MDGDLRNEIFKYGCVTFPRVLFSARHPYFSKKVNPNQTYGMIFVRLIEQAYYSAREVQDYGTGVTYLVQRGEVLISIRKLSTLTAVDKSTLSRILKSFQEYGLIRINSPDITRLKFKTPQPTSKIRKMNILTVCNYDELSRFDSYSKKHFDNADETPMHYSQDNTADKTKENDKGIKESNQHGMGFSENLSGKPFDEVFNLDYGSDICNVMPPSFLSRAHVLGVICQQTEADLIELFYDRYWNSTQYPDYRPRDWLAVWINHCKSG